MVRVYCVSFSSFCRWSGRLSDWEAMVAVQAAAAAAEEEEWGDIMVMLVAVQAAAAAEEEWGDIMVMLVAGHGNQPCRVFQKLELEKHYHPHYLSHKTLFGAAFHSHLFHEQQ